MMSDQEILAGILNIRLHDPDRPRQLALGRTRSHTWAKRSLVLVAADHPARRMVAAGADAWAMANRADLLRRVARVLMQPFVDGILATPDIIEELWMLQSLVTSQDGPNFMDGKVLIGSMNRAGLGDAVFELDDFVSAYSTEALVDSAIDAGKLLLRIDPQTELSSRTLRYVAEALEKLDAADLPVFLEPIPVPLSLDNLVRLVGVASALGPSSRRRWLKVPMVIPFARVAAATTCPLVLLGGAEAGTGDALLERVQACLDAGPNVRGVLMGRGVLYPTDHSDPREVMARLAGVIRGESVEEVVEWGSL